MRDDLVALVEKCKDDPEFSSHLVEQAFRDDNRELIDLLGTYCRKPGFRDLANAYVSPALAASEKSPEVLEEQAKTAYRVNHEMADVIFEEAKETDRWESIVYSFFGSRGPMTIEEMLPALAEAMGKEEDDIHLDAVLALDDLLESGKFAQYSGEMIYLAGGLPDTRKVTSTSQPKPKLKTARLVEPEDGGDPYLVYDDEDGEDAGREVRVSRELGAKDKAAREVLGAGEPLCDGCGTESSELQHLVVPMGEEGVVITLCPQCQESEDDGNDLDFFPSF